MKRLSALLAAMMLCFSLFAASAKPSMDGRAVVADIGELPIGLFAKSAAFLPGDTVVVTNPATRISIEVMIFGGYDSSEGIAIVLSPEAARELYITKGSNVIVQVTKKTDAWSENTILSKTVESYVPDEDPDVNQEMMIDDIEEPLFDTPGVMVEDVVFYVEEPILPPEEFVESTVEEELPVEEPVEEIPEPETVEAEIETEVESEVETECETDEPAAEPERSPLISRGTRFETVDDAEPEIETEPFDEKWALIPEDAEFVYEMNPEEEREIIFNPEEITYGESLDDGDVGVLDVTDEAVLSEEEESDTSEEFIVETEVILIPTEFFPPVVDPSFGLLPVVESDSDLPVVLEEEIEEEELEDEDSGLTDETDRVVILDYDDEDVAEPEIPVITVVSQSELPKGYYVQILTASKMTTVEDTQELYGKNYPMQFAESSRGGIQVLIGPLTPDEYAVIQARFRSYGYKDCFVRNIK